MSLRVSTQEIGRHLVLAFDGALDLSSLPRFSDALTKHLRPSMSAVLDLDGITVLDDAAVGILLGVAARRRDAGDPLAVVCTNPDIIDRLRRMGVGAGVPIVSSVLDIASP
ncbi:unannotated protein [freshwater metagenome]|uniref:Unannotated protein n=1 Tax=freshwater metagenome TaxID=449393 RepID=A0A6J6EU12_9ZZZZ|nr:STAS domain-containing protein [Actinomycetota bacterium]